MNGYASNFLHEVVVTLSVNTCGTAICVGVIVFDLFLVFDLWVN